MTFTGEIHPVADLFPMLADDELAELADDIKQRGLLQPIVLDSEGRLLDGRNRLAACDLARVRPSFTFYEGDDPDGYALAVNGQRREMTKAQKAIVAANFSKLEKFGDQRKAARALGISDSRVSEAKVIVEHSDLAERVLARLAPLPFSTALAEARDRDRKKVEEDAAKDRLRVEAADLLALVGEERMSLGDAVAALDAREEKARHEERERERKRAENQRDARALLARIVDLAAPTSMSSGFIEAWAEQLGESDEELGELLKRTEQAAQVLLDLTERIER